MRFFFLIVAIQGVLSVPLKASIHPTWFMPPWSLFNNATPVIHNCKDCFQLTDETPGIKGCIWDDTPVDFSGPIDVQAIVNFGDQDGNGADGICIVFAPSPGCGDTGAGIGAHGIPSAVIIEFDTWDNGGGYGDIPNDHVSVDINGNVQMPVLGPADLGNIEDGLDHTIRFYWDGAGGIEIYFDGALVLAGSYDLIGALGSSQVYMGFTASTGGATNNQIVCPDNIPVEGPDPAIFSQFDLEVCEGDQGVVYAVNPVPNVTYTWTAPPGASINGTGANITINWGSEGGEVCVGLDNGCGTSDTVCVLVEVTPIPDALATIPGALCEEEFDLTNIVLTNLNPSDVVTYHPSQAAASQGFPDLGTPPIVQLSGTYWLRIEAGDGCVQLLPVDIILEFPEIIVEQPDPVCAPNGIELSVVNIIDVNGLQLVDVQFFLSASDAFQGVNPLINTYITSSGTYWVKATTIYGCFDVASIEVVVHPQPVVQAEQTPNLCEGETFDLNDLEIVDGNGMNPSDYVITFHSTEQEAINGSPMLDPPVVNLSGTYWIRMTSLAGCFHVFPIQIDFLSAPGVTLSAPDTICEGDLVPLVFEFNGVPGYQVMYTDGQDTFLFNSQNPNHTEWLLLTQNTTYWVINLQDNTPPGCPVLLGELVTINILEKLAISPPLVVCENDFYTVTFSLFEGDALSWQVSGTQGMQSGTSFQSVSLPSGQPYSFAIWDVNGCDTIVLAGTPDCSCQTNAGTFLETEAQVCIGDTLTLTYANDGFLDSNDIRQYILFTGTPGDISQVLQWSNLPVFYFNPANMQPGATYYAAPIAGNNLAGQVDTLDLCFSLIKAIPITFRMPPSWAIPQDDAVCLNQTYILPIELIGTPPFQVTYQIGLNAPTTQTLNSNTLNITLPTTSSVSVVFSQISDAYCSQLAMDTFLLSVISGPTVSNFIFNCNGTNTEFTLQFTISGGDSATYFVTGGLGNLQGNVFTSGTISVGTFYSFIINDAYGCKPYTVSGNYACLCLTNAGSINGGPFNLCLEDSISFTNPGAYLDSNDTLVWWLVTDPINPFTSRVYAYKDKTLFYPGLPIIPGQLYYLIGIAGNIGPDAGLDAQDACLDYTQAVPVQFILPPNLDALFATPTSVFTCVDTLITIEVQASATGSLNYKWSTQGGMIQGSTTSNIIQTLEPGWYTVTVTESMAGCMDTIGLALLIDKNVPIIQISNPSDLTCLNNSVTLDAGLSSMAADIKATWTTWNGSIVGGANSYMPLVNAQGSYLLTLTNESSKCIAQDSVNVVTDTIPPIAEAGADVAIACGQAIPLLDGSQSSGQGTLAFLWSTMDGDIEVGANSVIATATGPGTYQLVVTDSQNGCSATDMVVIQVEGGLSNPEIVLGPPLCAGDITGIVEITGLQGGMPPYMATLAGINFPVPGMVSQIAAGSYALSIVDGQGCSWDTLLVLDDPIPLQLDLGLDLQITLGESVTLLPLITGGTGGVNAYIWTMGNEILCQGCTSLNLEPIEAMIISLMIEDSLGCTAMDEMAIQVKVPKKVFVPNSFSPNADGINDLFAIYGGDVVKRVHRMAVFDRWGNDLFVMTDFLADGNQGWNGKYRGIIMDPGVYVWYAEIEFIDGAVLLYKGDVHLIR